MEPFKVSELKVEEIEVSSYGFIMPDGYDNIEFEAPKGINLKDAYSLFDNIKQKTKE